jgi:aminoglycoside 3-N-acetyltransferase
MRAYYTRSEFAEALAAVGVERGDVIFSHSNIGFFGLPIGEVSASGATNTALSAIQDVIGPKGTIVVPTFTLSFCKGQVFDVQRSASNCGVFAEAVRNHPGASRTSCPLFSVAAIGAEARAITADVSSACFGSGSVWERLLERNATICNFNLDAGSTLLHHIEWRLGVPYRRERQFDGVIVNHDKPRNGTASYFSRDLDDVGSTAAFELFDKIARERGKARTSRVGRGAVVGIRAGDTYSIIAETLACQPRFLTRAGRSEPRNES